MLKMKTTKINGIYFLNLKFIILYRTNNNMRIIINV